MSKTIRFHVRTEVYGYTDEQFDDDATREDIEARANELEGELSVADINVMNDETSVDDWDEVSNV